MNILTLFCNIRTFSNVLCCPCLLFRFLAQVPPDALKHFREAAEALVEERGAVDAVAAALAHISGTTEIKSRSLLSSQEVLRGVYNYITVAIRVYVNQSTVCNDTFAAHKNNPGMAVLAFFFRKKDVGET